MLNGFSKNNPCPVCNKKLQNLYGIAKCQILNNGFSHFELSDNDNVFESVFIGNYYMIFYCDGFEIYTFENQAFQYETIITCKNSFLKFSDLNTIEKIEEFVRNYKILC